MVYWPHVTGALCTCERLFYWFVCSFSFPEHLTSAWHRWRQAFTLASLGLPGFSGFMAEMQIFVGAFQHPDMFHRVATIITISAIVITAVYVLRVVGMMLMGPIKNDDYLVLDKVTWYEKVGVLLLLIPIVFMGVTPIWLSDMIRESIAPFIERMM